MPPRKTISIAQLKTYIHDQLERTDSMATDTFKARWCTALGKVLHEAGACKGFQYNYRIT